MNNQIQPYNNQQPQPYRQQPPALANIIMLLAILYWLSPVDLLPGLPFDDIAVMLIGLALRNGMMGE